MQLTEEDIKEFQTIWQAHSGQVLSVAEARQCATRLMKLYLLLVRPLPDEGTPEHPPTSTI